MTRDFLRKACADKKEVDIGCSKNEAEDDLDAKLILCEYSEVILNLLFLDLTKIYGKETAKPLESCKVQCNAYPGLLDGARYERITCGSGKKWYSWDGTLIKKLK